MYKIVNAERVIRWRLILEEYNPKLNNVKASKNVAADALSRLGKVDTNNRRKTNMSSLVEYYSLEKEDILNPANCNFFCNINQVINL